MRKIVLAGITVLSILTLAACGSGPTGDSGGIGGITATAVWPGSSPSGKADAIFHKAPAEVAWVRMIVSKGTTTLQADFAVAEGSGSISSVPAGSGWTLTFQGLNAAKTSIYFQGSKTGITVTGGATTNAGTVTMFVLSSASGVLDTSFDTDGIVYSTSVPTTNGGGAIYGIAIQPDGKIVTAGSVGMWMGVAVYLPSGTLDTSIGPGGLITIPTNSSGLARAIAVQPDGKIVVAGVSTIAGGRSRFTLSRGDNAGNPDIAFGGGTAIVSTPVGTTGSNGANAIGVLPGTGDIVAAGYAQGPGSTNTTDFALGFYTSGTGSLYSTKTESFFTCTIASCADQAYGLVVQPDGKVLLAGTATADGGEYMALARYESTGGLDVSFNSTGKVTFQTAGSTSCQAKAVALQPDGRIVVGGNCIILKTAVSRLFSHLFTPSAAVNLAHEATAPPII